eukprot:Gb_33761 [translate_table: standard]
MAGLPKNQLLPNRIQGFCLPPKIPRGLSFRISGIRSEVKTQNADDSVAVDPLYISQQNQSKLLLNINNKDSKIVLPPRVCTLRAFGKSGDGIVKAEPDRMSSFFNSLLASIDHSAKIKDWEILSGRLAMIVFAAAVMVEVLTGNSLFQKMDVQKICEIGGVCVASVVCAAGFAWASRAKSQVATIVSERYNEFVDSVIDQLVDGLFYEDEGV